MRNLLKTLACGCFALGLVLPAAGQQQERASRRLKSVTWNPVDHKLTWTVTDGKLKGGEFLAGEDTTYEIDMDEATMTFNGEDRGFSKNEAVRVHALMDLITKYAAESTVWWEQGQGVPIPKGAKPEKGKNGTQPPRKHQRQQPEESDGTGVIRISWPAQR